MQPDNLSLASTEDYEILKPSEKEFANHHLLHTIKQVNGELAFKQAYQKSLVFKFLQRSTVPEEYSHNHFCYILQGQVYVYKVVEKSSQLFESYENTKNKMNNLAKGVFVTCHKIHQIFGLQQYPLNICQKLIFEATENTKIIVFPVQLSLSSFKKIFNMSLVQYRAELLKKSYFFKQLELQKLKKIALYSKRYQGKKGQILLKEGDPFTHIPLIIYGQVMIVLRGNCTQIFGKDKIIGLQELLQDEQAKSNYDLVFMDESEVILIPKAQIIKIYKIKYRLQDKDSINPKTIRQTEYQTQKPKQQKKQFKLKEKSASKIKSFIYDSEDIKQKNRPNTTSAHRKNNLPLNQMKYSTIYNNKSDSQNSRNRFKTQISETTPFKNSNHNQPFGAGLAENISLGQLCLRKFIHRKQRRQNCEIMKYLRSNAPQLKLNPSKQYAVVKPMHVSDSSYVKNLKRKLKKSYIKTGVLKQREQKRKQARFSFFFQQDEQV